MLEFLNYNLNSYLNKPLNTHLILRIISIIIPIILLIYSILNYSYNIYHTTAINECFNNVCTLSFTIPKKEDFLTDLVIINNHEYFINQISFENISSYDQKITLKLKEYQGINKEVVNLQIFKNKEKLISKIYQIIVER